MTDFTALIKIEITKDNYDHWAGFYTLLGQALQDFDLQTKGDNNGKSTN